MQRDIMADLIEWRNSPARKPLVLQGARQVGKTWAIKELARTSFSRIAYVDFLVDENLRSFVTANGLEPGLRLSLAGFDRQPWVTNVPLYAIDLLPDFS